MDDYSDEEDFDYNDLDRADFNKYNAKSKNSADTKKGGKVKRSSAYDDDDDDADSGGSVHSMGSEFGDEGSDEEFEDVSEGELSLEESDEDAEDEDDKGSSSSIDDDEDEFGADGYGDEEDEDFDEDDEIDEDDLDGDDLDDDDFGFGGEEDEEDFDVEEDEMGEDEEDFYEADMYGSGGASSDGPKRYDAAKLKSLGIDHSASPFASALTIEKRQKEAAAAASAVAASSKKKQPQPPSSDEDEEYEDEEGDFDDEEDFGDDEEDFDDEMDAESTPSSSSGGAPPAGRSPLLSAPVQPQLRSTMRRLLNQIALTNVADHSKTISDLFQNNARAAVLGALSRAAADNFINTDIKLTFPNAMPTAALHRALQLMHGNAVTAVTIEYISHSLEEALQTLFAVTYSVEAHGDDSPAGLPTLTAAETHLENAVMLLCAAAALRCFDAELILSLMQLLIAIATGSTTSLQRAKLFGSRPAASTVPASKRGRLAGTATTNADIPEPFMAAASACALALIGTIGEQLRKAAPTQLHRTVEALRAAASAASNAAINGDAGAASQSIRARQAVLLALMKEVAAGKRFKAPKKKAGAKKPVNTFGNISLGDADSMHMDGADPNQPIIDEAIEALGDHLEALQRANAKSKKAAAASSRKVIEESVASLNVLPAFPWHFMTRFEKPPKWYQGVSTADLRATDDTVEPKAKKSAAKKRLRDEDGSEEDASSSSSDDDSDYEGAAEEAHAAAQLKRETIKRIRDEEKAISGQRFTSEAKRDIFKCVTAASDDMEAFLALTNYDQDGSQSQDIAAVILQIVTQDSVYRPFYAHLLQRLFSARKQFRKSLQYAIWDRFKQIRILAGAPDVTSYVNLACLVADILKADIYSLALLRGLDLEHVDKNIGLFARILLLRIITALPAKQLTALFFGGDISKSGVASQDLNIETKFLRRNLSKFFSIHFADEEESKKWIPLLFDVVAAGTAFDADRPPAPEGAEEEPAEDISQLAVRIRVVAKALKQGI